MKSFAALLLLAFCASLSLGAAFVVPVQQDKSSDIALAPDGKRGFGRELDQKRLSQLLRSKEAADNAFFDELTELTMSTRIQLLNVRQHYVERGYFRWLSASAGDDLALLHSTYAKSYESPGRDLAAGDARAKALAAMLVDTRFNVRRELMQRAQISVDDLERARAVFDATQNGYVSLTPAELGHIAARADLAAAELRVLRSDLEALTPSAADRDVGEQAVVLAKRLLESSRIREEGLRAKELLAVLAPCRDLEQRMANLLSSTRLEPKLAPLRQWRERVLTAAASLRVRVLELLPDTAEGDKPRAEISRMKKTERMNQAYGLAIEGLGNDPLDPELAWAAGHARYLAWPGLDSILYFDRFLALVGIRTSDANPGAGRKLSPREQEAFSAVTTFKR